MSNSRDLARSMAELTCELARTCNEKEQYFAACHDLTPAEFKCLRLFKDKKEMSIKDIIYVMKITPGRITHILTSLEEKEYIERFHDPEDKRNVVVRLTSKSKPFIKKINENHVKLHIELLDKIEPEKREMVLSAMEDVIRALKVWSEGRN